MDPTAQRQDQLYKKKTSERERERQRERLWRSLVAPENQRKARMVGGRLGETIGVREELIKKACSLDLKAHKTASGKPYLCEKSRGSSEAIFSFSGSWTAEDWFSGKSFGGTGPEDDLGLFPSLRSIGTGEVAVVNRAFLARFQAILRTSSLEKKVNKAAREGKHIVFTGHSSGGPVAILATLWFLEQYPRPNSSSQNRPVCVTFGSPLVGNWIFPHALRRENWDDFFIHFIMRYDIVPRLMLAPLSSLGQQLQPMLQSFNPKPPLFGHDSAAMSTEFFMMVMRSASSVASHAACKTMGCTNSLLETVTGFVELSPYRPFGTCIFCTGDGKLVVVKNPDAVLQLLFYSSQLTCMEEGGQVAYDTLKEHLDKSLNEHLGYAAELQESLEMQNVVYLDNNHLRELPLSSNGSPQGETATIGTALNDLGLSTRARLCLRAAGELQAQKQKNQEKKNPNKDDIKRKLKDIRDYQSRCCEVRGVGYYDAFKLQDDTQDFSANVTRLELAGMWDEIIEMLKRRELPDGFECQKVWIELGTEYRRLVEPLDIANYYRHLKNEDTGPYLINARPKRYRYTQRWLEHAERMPQGSSSESCFWATVEDLKSGNRPFADVKGEILHLENNMSEWVKGEKIGSDVFLANSTFSMWWKTLPDQHRGQSWLKDFVKI
ncbi:protein EDS1-like isoform X2 [Diospyros lotus]|uniref:protein EDS1-like isoform X2 n=1 Tax=Diospyros lotus TaxID=55363 RepID=UPI00224D70AC|nr:protein EDS1-like isoform X2 [Diospyros lotus]